MKVVIGGNFKRVIEGRLDCVRQTFLGVRTDCRQLRRRRREEFLPMKEKRGWPPAKAGEKVRRRERGLRRNVIDFRNGVYVN